MLYFFNFVYYSYNKYKCAQRNEKKVKIFVPKYYYYRKEPNVYKSLYLLFTIHFFKIRSAITNQPSLMINVGPIRSIGYRNNYVPHTSEPSQANKTKQQGYQKQTQASLLL